MRIQPAPTRLPTRRLQPPRPQTNPQAHDQSGQEEDFLRVTSRALGTAASRVLANSRTLNHLNDAADSLGAGGRALNAGLGIASLGLAAVDTYQARQAYQAGDKTMALLNLGGGLANLAGGAASLNDAFSGQTSLPWGSLSMSASILFDAAEDFVEARRLDQPLLQTRGWVKSTGAGLMVAGTLSGNLPLQTLGNLVALGGIAMHYVPKTSGSSASPD